ASDHASMCVEPYRAVAPRQGRAEIDAAVEPRKEMSFRLVRGNDDAPGYAFFMVHAPKRLRGVGVAQSDLGRAQVLRAGDILGARKLIETEEGGRRTEDVELARRIVDQRLRIAGDERIALAASEYGSCEVVNIGEIVPIIELPGRCLELDIGVKSLRALHLVGRVSETRAELAKLQRVRQVEVITKGRLAVISRDDRIMCIEAHSLERVVRAALRYQRIQRNPGGRSHPPLLELGTRGHQLGAEEANRAEVLTDLCFDDRRIEAFTGVIIDEERAVGPELRAEK